MQWMNTGSGVMHAEGGADEVGQRMQGFQIWVNVPKDRKLDRPDYGTVSPDKIPIQTVGDGVVARVLAGTMFDTTGPFRTKQDVQMVDFELEPGASIETSVGPGLDTAVLYVYEGSLKDANGNVVENQSVMLFDAEDEAKRGVQLTASDEKAGVLLFTGKKLKEEIAWHGPIVMNTHKQIADTFKEMRSGDFPPVRVDWDYRDISSKPDSGPVTSK